MATEGASASTSECSEKTEATNTAADLLAQGKRNLVCGEIQKAVSLYEEATQLLVKSCGDLSRDCAAAYFGYGSALLELGRMETNVLGTALGAVDVEEDKDGGVSKQDEEPSQTESTDEKEEEAEEDEGNIEDKDTEEGEDVEEEEKEEDVSSFQLAWEYLDLAKVIYLKSESSHDQLKAAECYIKLGEVSMETEQHVTAAEDLESALNIQQKFLDTDDRLLAETHYQLGLAYCLGKQFDLSVQHYTQAVSVIEQKIASLTCLVGKVDVTGDNTETQSELVKKYQAEIRELQELIPEMKIKIEDARQEAKDMEHMKQMAKEALGFCSPSKKFPSPTKRAESSSSDKGTDVDENGKQKASDIAHLVRRKRKPENDMATSDDIEVKKLQCDSAAVGDSTASCGPEINGSSI